MSPLQTCGKNSNFGKGGDSKKGIIEMKRGKSILKKGFDLKYQLIDNSKSAGFDFTSNQKPDNQKSFLNQRLTVLEILD